LGGQLWYSDCEWFKEESALWLFFPLADDTSMLIEIVASQKCHMKELQLKLLTPVALQTFLELASRGVEIFTMTSEVALPLKEQKLLINFIQTLKFV